MTMLWRGLARRAAALAILAGVLATVWIGLVRPITRRIDDAEQEALRAEEAIDRYATINSAQERIAADVALASEALDQQQDVLEPIGEAAGGAQLQQVLQEVVEARGGGLRSIRVLPSEDGGVFVKLGLQVDLTTTTAGMLRILNDIETHRPRLFIESANIRSMTNPARKGAQPEPRATLKLDVVAFMRKR